MRFEIVEAGSIVPGDVVDTHRGAFHVREVRRPDGGTRSASDSGALSAFGVWEDAGEVGAVDFDAPTRRVMIRERAQVADRRAADSRRAVEGVGTVREDGAVVVDMTGIGAAFAEIDARAAEKGEAENMTQAAQERESVSGIGTAAAGHVLTMRTVAGGQYRPTAEYAWGCSCGVHGSLTWDYAGAHAEADEHAAEVGSATRIAEEIVGGVFGSVLDPATSQVGTYGEIVADTLPEWDGDGGNAPGFCWNGWGVLASGGTVSVREYGEEEDDKRPRARKVSGADILAAVERIAAMSPDVLVADPETPGAQAWAFCVAASAAMRAEAVAAACAEGSWGRKVARRLAAAMMEAAEGQEDAGTADEVFQVAAWGRARF